MTEIFEEIGFQQQVLDKDSSIFVRALPPDLIWCPAKFATFWNLHPHDYHAIMMHGRPVKTPRWQQAFGQDYHYTGNINKAFPTPPELRELLEWARDEIHADLNGALVNWYDSTRKHYIGPHHDSITNMVPDAPIVTTSFGENRIFRLIKEEGKGKQKKIVAKRDSEAPHGSVFVMPYQTNLAWKHCVPHFARYMAKRISITLRAFHHPK